ncbi:hypothetical protein M431DRAFT_556676, partial [Trichoderma harzianum CBS 226.95]
MSNPKDYTVGWLCAISTELVAARAFLDEEHAPPNAVSSRDSNIYTLGKMGQHNVVIAALPDGGYGISAAASVARDMLSSFPNVRVGLMVGIGGGVPTRHDIRLGDVVVSTPQDEHGGIFQYDFGKTIQAQEFQDKKFLDQPPTLLRSAVCDLKARYQSDGHQIQETIKSILAKKPKLRKNYQRPDPRTDRLYLNDAVHPSTSNEGCAIACSDSMLVSRGQRAVDEDDPTIHYGLIASGSQLMKDASIRDKLAFKKDILCFEMEAAGLMNHFPCLVIRGICDYSDSHKNNIWQGYAAMTAAAYAKDLIGRISPAAIETETRITAVLSKVQNSLNQLDNRHHAEINLAILDWLSPLDYSTQQADHQGVRQKGSGEWFLNADKFQRWVKEENQMLLCPGMPGAGKTIMMSVVVDHLLSKFREDPKPGIAYFYFDYKLQDEQNIGRLLGCLLRQLVAYLPSLPEVVYRLYEKNNNPGRRTRPSNEDLFQALKFVTMSYPRVYVLIDALDHYKPPKDPRLAITRCISEIRTETGANILVTSRFDPEITSGFSSIHSLEIRASNEDVQRYVKASMVHLPRFIQDDPKLQDEVTADLNNSATYDEHYTNMMKIIDNQSEQEKELASSVLSWLILAKRPMRVTELQHAVSVKPGESKFDHGNMPDIGRMVSVCAGLVKVGDESKIIELIHHTAQEYLQQMFVIWFPEARSKITRTCITYLSYKVSELIPGDDRDPIISHIDSHPFYGYASLYWGKHAREEPLLSREVKEFLTDTARIKSYRKILKHVQWHEDRLGDSGLKQQTTGLHLAAWFGLTEAVPLLLNKFPINVKNKFRETALHIATHRADKDIIQLLLDNKAKTKVKNKLGRTPLHIAAEDSDEDVVEQLLNGGASIEAIDRWGDTPLHLAAYTGLGVIVPVLLERDANINPAGQNG